MNNLFKKEFTKLVEIEKRHNLLEKKISDYKYWELVRFSIFHNIILIQKGIHKKAHPSLNRYEKMKYLFKVIFYLFKNPFFSRKKQLLIWGHERKKKENKKYYDIYFDEFIRNDNHSKLYIEKSYIGKHFVSSSNYSKYYYEAIELFSLIIRFFKPLRITKNESIYLYGIQKMLNKELGTNYDYYNLIVNTIKQIDSKRKVLKILLKQINPSCVLLVVSYFRKALIYACKDLGIPTVEFQHGIITKYHLGYSFPEKYIADSFPDYFFSFGKIWLKNIQLPLAENRVKFVGFPYYDYKKDSIDKPNDRNTITIISQGTIGHEICKYAVKLNSIFSNKYNIVYRIHPGEKERWENLYPELNDELGKSVKENEDVDLYQLFNKSKYVVGVNSTSLVEALAFNCNVLVLKLNGYEYMEEYIKHGFMNLIDTDSFDIEKYKNFEKVPVFKDDSIRNIEKYIEELSGLK